MGELGRAAQLLGDAKIAAPSPEVKADFQRLLARQAPGRETRAADPADAEEVPAQHLGKALRKAPRCSSPGPAGGRFSHWQACKHSPSAMAALRDAVGGRPAKRRPD